jgi:hypothetical protein
LDALLLDVAKGGELELIDFEFNSSVDRNNNNETSTIIDMPILNNVSLAEAIRQNSSNRMFFHQFYIYIFLVTDSVLYEFFDLPSNGAAIAFGGDANTMPTPTLTLNETDANYWFTNSQVRADVSDSFALRDRMLSS